MKLDCGLSGAEYHKYISNWHRWFAWRPVRVASRDCRWLEYVERREKFHAPSIGTHREYRAI